MTWAPAELAYLAGIIDGEGCFSIVRGVDQGKLRYRLRVHAANNSRPLMDWIIARFGGRFYAMARPSGKPVYQWHCLDASVSDIVTAIRPYLVVKERQADVALRFRPCGEVSRRRVSDEEWQRRQECWLEMAALNLAGGKVRKGKKSAATEAAIATMG